MAETTLSRLRQIIGEQLAASVRGPLPDLTRRRVFGRLRFPGKATAVTGMRRTGKTTFLHQLRRERIERGVARSACPTCRSRTNASRTSTPRTSTCSCPSTAAGSRTRATPAS